MRIGLRASSILIAVASAATPLLAHADPVVILAAGSLRGVVSDLAAAGNAVGIEVRSVFGGSGLLRGRIEKGEKADLFLSADLGHPRKLQASGRTVLPVVLFARNRMCVVARRAGGVTEKNLVDRLLADGVRVKTSTPIADPSGDYAWTILDRIEAARPGAGAKLKEKAQANMTLTAPAAAPGQSAAAALFAANLIDVWITYCSASAGVEKEIPGLASIEVPPALDPHPMNGLAVLSDRPEVLRLAVLLLSEEGQAIVGRNGLVPVGATDPLSSPP
ncbi:MAG TPA: substrate-binding domain-containing protein [Gammaproteobacteria bacterium]|nr:substrate-binding domain-containing protein [Gammaproteobacteria bacterium]